MNEENDESFFYDPNLLVVPASPNLTETLDDFDELIDIATLSMHFDDGFVIENVDPAHDGHQLRTIPKVSPIPNLAK
ncbi:hypothetical protein QTP88_002515 [Uroleucon formosanum]